MQHSSTSGPFHWQRSDNSFRFSFSPDFAPMDPDESAPGPAADSDTGSGFAFNFQIPAGTEQRSEPNPDAGETAGSKAAPGSESKPTAKKNKKKKKKSGTGGGEEAAPENKNKLREEAPKQENTQLTPEQQLSRELDWCIEQLELGLKTRKSSSKQKEEASRALKTLRSSKAPVVKKRQVMRAVSGDYRKKMEEERDRQFKLIHSAMSSAKVTCVSEPRSSAVYHRHTETPKPPVRSTHPADASLPAEQTDGDRFIFRPSGEEFRFNFNL